MRHNRAELCINSSVTRVTIEDKNIYLRFSVSAVEKIILVTGEYSINCIKCKGRGISLSLDSGWATCRIDPVEGIVQSGLTVEKRIRDDNIQSSHHRGGRLSVEGGQMLVYSYRSAGPGSGEQVERLSCNK